MKTRKLFLKVSLFLLCSASISLAQVQMQLIGPQKAVSFILKNEHLPHPLAISGDQNGSLFFETATKRTFLTGEPTLTANTNRGFYGKWEKIEGRSIEIRMLTRGPEFEISFKAVPDADILRWGLQIKAADRESFIGLMERVIDGKQNLSWQPGISEALNLRGQHVNMLVKPTLSLYMPFYLSSAGYGLWVSGTWPGEFDFCREKENRVSIQFEGPFLNFKIFASSDPKRIVQTHAQEVGPPFLPPRWAFRPWRWRDDHENKQKYYDGTPVKAPYNSQVVEDILMMQALDIPCGVYWVDRPWATGRYGYNDFEWDLKRLPNPQKMIQWLHRRNIKFLLWIAPWVQGRMAREAIFRGYAMPGQKKHARDRVLIDFSHPEARSWWQETGVKKILKDGVDGFKLDRAEEMVPGDRNVFVFNGHTTRENFNDYPRQYIEATFAISQKIRGQDFILMPRSGYTGSVRYGVFWGGDIPGTQWGLRAAIIAVQRAAILGFPIWGSDTGGYWGGFDREVTARWLAFSSFTPLMEVGPTLNRGFWDLPKKPHYDVELIAIWRLYARLHDRLVNYSYQYAKEAHETGMPVVRPLFLAFPEQKQAWEDWQTYLYGNDILVSPIWQKGQTQKEVYLPSGVKWRDAWNSEDLYDGGQTITVQTPLEKIPIFVREGSAVDLGNLRKLYQQSLAVAKNRPDLAKLQQEAQWNK